VFSIRNIRRDALDSIRKQEKNSEISEMKRAISRKTCKS
jgi:ribosome recycling factor